MCGRYVTVSSPALLAERFHVTEVRPAALEPSYNVAPRADVPVVAERHGARVLDVVRWGLVPFWAKDPSIGDRMINARAEKVLSSNAYKRAFERKRCIVPADGFYEWQKLGPKEKQAYSIGLAGGALFGLAGLWERWQDKASGETVFSCAIVTTAANALCAPIHDRMPVILDPGAYAPWLGETRASPDELLALLAPFPAERMEAFKIGPAIGNVKNDGPELIARVG